MLNDFLLNFVTHLPIYENIRLIFSIYSIFIKTNWILLYIC